MKGIINILFATILSAASICGQIDKPLGIEKKFSVYEELQIKIQPTEAQSWEKKLSPNLAHIVNRHSKELGSKMFDGSKFINNNKFTSLKMDQAGNITVQVFVKSNNYSATKSIIETKKGEVYSVINGILASEISLNSIKELANDESTLYIEAGTYKYPLLDVSRVEVKADKVHDGIGLPQSYRGDGVVVGVVDSGIDWEHDDFSGTQGTRIKYLWDMSGTSNPPSAYGYGTEYTKAQIDNNQCSAIDGDDGGGHGTHVSATAAGSGTANLSYLGIAPSADIIFVKGFRNSASFSDVDVVNGCNYIFQKSQSMGMPAVINLSLGGHFGSHDGTSLYEQSLSGLTGPGKIIAAAAGNEGSDNIHLSYTTSGSGLNDANQTFWVINQGASQSLVDMWYNTGNISVGIAAYDAQLNYIGATNPVAPGQKIEDIPFEINGTTYGIVTIDATNTADPNNGAKRVYFVIGDGNGTYNLSAVYWVLYTFGTGTFDAWMATGGFFSTDNNPASGIYPGDNNKSIGMPGTAQKLICVGSYVTKNQWVDIDGSTQIQGGNPTIGALSTFSSLGPSRDGRTKPDLTAPGEVIVAALSGDVTIGPGGRPRSNIILGGLHQKMQGTSMATPHVAGAVALMLQRNPSLNYSEVINLLQTTARKDNFTGSGSNNSFGSGKLDVLAAVQNVTGGGTTQTTLIQEGFDGVFPPAGWTQVITLSSNTWEQGNPTNYNFNAIDPTSTNSAICSWIAQNQDEFLITPLVQLGSGTAFVEFYAGYSTQWLSNATMSLLISTDGSNYTQIWTAENDGQDWSWRLKNVDLSAYADQSIKLAWRYLGNDGDLVGLDGVKVVSTSGTTDIDYETKTIPTEFNLSQNYPNPFNPSTAINYQIPQEGLVKLIIYDALGREVKTLVNEFKTKGVYEEIFNANNFASGIYIYQLKVNEFVQTRKMMLLK